MHPGAVQPASQPARKHLPASGSATCTIEPLQWCIERQPRNHALTSLARNDHHHPISFFSKHLLPYDGHGLGSLSNVAPEGAEA